LGPNSGDPFTQGGGDKFRAEAPSESLVKDHGSEEIGVLSLDCADYVHVWIEDIP